MESSQNLENKESIPATDSTKGKIRNLVGAMPGLSGWESVNNEKDFQTVRFPLGNDDNFVEIKIDEKEPLSPFKKGSDGKWIYGKSRVWIILQRADQAKRKRKLSRKIFFVDDRDEFFIKETSIEHEEDLQAWEQAEKNAEDAGISPKKRGLVYRLLSFLKSKHVNDMQNVKSIYDNYLLAIAEGRTDFRNGTEKEAQEALSILASLKGKK